MLEAEAMVEAGRGEELLDIVYIGQELRGDAKQHFVHFLAHFTTGGSPVFYELCSRTHDCYCVPLAQSRTSTAASAAGGTAAVNYGFSIAYRIINFLSPQAEMVNIFEGGMVRLLHWLGVLLGNVHAMARGSLSLLAILHPRWNARRSVGSPTWEAPVTLTTSSQKTLSGLGFAVPL